MKLTKKQRTQLEIINAAKDIIHDKGHTAITVRHLAEITGYAYTNLYYYFKDLNGLLWALRFNMIEDMIVELSGNPQPMEDPVEEILNAFNSYCDYFFEHPNVFRFFYFHPFVKPEDDHSYDDLENRFQGIWQNSFFRLVSEGVLKPSEVELVAKTIIYALQGMIMLSFSSNGTMNNNEIKVELSRLVVYLMNRK
jgi:AcrR family transcriptional regulator